MGKPHVPYRAKRLLEAALECSWDFEIIHGPATLYVTLMDGTSRIDGQWRKSSDIDGSGRETTSYRQLFLVLDAGHARLTTSLTIDEAENFIHEHSLRAHYRKMA